MIPLGFALAGAALTLGVIAFCLGACRLSAAADRAAGEPVVPVTAVVIAFQRFDVRV